MELIQVKLKNFRAYRDTTIIPFDDLTAFIGKNDIGKSTILEALEGYFNGDSKGSIVTFEKEDLNIYSGDLFFEITCVFSSVPDTVIIDADIETSLSREYLLNSDGNLEIKKKYDFSGSKVKQEVFIVCEHPTSDDLKDLLLLKNPGLKSRAKKLEINSDEYNATINSEIREAIRNSFGTIETATIDLPANRDDMKEIYDAIKPYLPLYALFQSDRNSNDGDREIADPMKVAIQQALQKVSPELEQIKQKVKEEAMEIAQRTLEKLNEMSPDIASSLAPEFISEPKFDSAFKLHINSDDNIPMNKRGSGIRRLLLLNFFRAEADRKMAATSHNSVIYAFEEPETSQHPEQQALLMDAFSELSLKENVQVILTTHTPSLAGMIDVDKLRLIESTERGRKVVYGTSTVYQSICDDLGLLPDPIGNNIRAILLVEGPGDVVFVNHISEQLYVNGVTNTTFERERFAIIPIGGCSTLKYWRNLKLIEQFDLPWCILLDSDVGAEENTLNIEKISALRDEGIKAYVTRKREPENYIAPECIGLAIEYSDTDDAKKIIGEAARIRSGNVLQECWPNMSFEQIRTAEKYIEDGVEHYEFEEMFNDFYTLTLD